MHLGGSLTRQAESDHNVSDASPHIANIGQMVEVRVDVHISLGSILMTFLCRIWRTRFVQLSMKSTLGKQETLSMTWGNPKSLLLYTPSSFVTLQVSWWLGHEGKANDNCIWIAAEVTYKGQLTLSLSLSVCFHAFPRSIGWSRLYHWCVCLSAVYCCVVLNYNWRVYCFIRKTCMCIRVLGMCFWSSQNRQHNNYYTLCSWWTCTSG